MSLESREITINNVVVREETDSTSSTSQHDSPSTRCRHRVAMFVRRHPKHGVIGFPVVSQAVAVRRSSKKKREAAVVLRNSNNTCHARMIDHHHSGAVSSRKRRGRAHRSHREMQLVIALGGRKHHLRNNGTGR